MKQITKITLAYELDIEKVPKSHIAKRLNINRDTVYDWLGKINHHGGLEQFLDYYSKAKKKPRKKRKVDATLKKRIYHIREREKDCCGQKIKYFLKKEFDQDLSVTRIYEILSEKYQLRSKWSKNVKRGDCPKASKIREVVQMDTVDFGDIFAYTAVDIYSKEVDVLMLPSLEAVQGAKFLDTAMIRRFNGFSDTIQSDGGSEFKKEFKEKVYEYTDNFRIARPYKKNEQSYIESFNRTLRKEALGWIKYKKVELNKVQEIVDTFLIRYHTHRPHINLGMKTPQDFLKGKGINFKI